MAVQTLNLVIARVDLVREVDRLYRLIALLIAKPAKDRALPHDGDANQRYQQRNNFCGAQTHRMITLLSPALERTLRPRLRVSRLVLVVSLALAHVVDCVADPNSKLRSDKAARGNESAPPACAPDGRTAESRERQTR